jgi:hypothetical protein
MAAADVQGLGQPGGLDASLGTEGHRLDARCWVGSLLRLSRRLFPRGEFFMEDGAIVVMAAVGCGLLVAFWHYEVPVATRPRMSCLVDAVGPGVQLTVAAK